MEVAIFLMVVGAVFGGVGALASSCRGRSGWEGFTFGFLLGPLGCLIAALIPGPPAQHTAPAPAPQPATGRQDASRAIRQATYEPRPRRLLGEVPEGPPRGR